MRHPNLNIKFFKRIQEILHVELEFAGLYSILVADWRTQILGPSRELLAAPCYILMVKWLSKSSSFYCEKLQAHYTILRKHFSPDSSGVNLPYHRQGEESLLNFKYVPLSVSTAPCSCCPTTRTTYLNCITTMRGFIVFNSPFIHS